MDKRGKKKGTTPMDAALRYLTMKPRTVLEMELYLDKCEFGEFEVYQVIERLKELNYLNDAEYAQNFIQTRLATKPISRRKLREQLYAHKLSKETIEEALSAVSDGMEAKNAAAIAAKYARQFENLPDPERKQRVMQRLCARGFEYAAVRECMDALLGGCAENEYFEAARRSADAEDDEL